MEPMLIGESARHRGKLADLATFFLETCIGRLLDSSKRSARRVTSALLDRGILTSPTTRAPLRLAFPATLAGRWMPGLFSEKR